MMFLLRKSREILDYERSYSSFFFQYYMNDHLETGRGKAVSSCITRVVTRSYRKYKHSVIYA